MAEFLFVVVTDVPKDCWCDEFGVLAPAEGFREDCAYVGIGPGADAATLEANADRLVHVRLPAFHCDEIIVVDPLFRREVGWPYRTPHKWFIGFEVYGRLEEAVARVRQIVDADNRAIIAHGMRQEIPPPTVAPLDVQTAQKHREKSNELCRRIQAIPPEVLRASKAGKKLIAALGLEAPTGPLPVEGMTEGDIATEIRKKVQQEERR